MNFGILLVQRLVDSFGPVVMAAFAASVKIDSFAYLPVQDFGNAFSTFAAQNYGAGKNERVRAGLPEGDRDKRSFLGICLTRCLRLRRSAHADIRERRGNRRHRGGNKISSH